MVKVTYNGTVLAEDANPPVVEGNYYFPPNSVKLDVFSPSSTTSVCPWKGTASYYNASVGGQNVNDIAWYYPHPKSSKAEHIKDHVAFYKNKVSISD
ncbi:hypothetical protein EIP91_002569 [Steccherinum ochraceum]|uniref:DUF427 domain-containing protein n=1 Tax=Steccherinum ochraceum TaxID=92696 RepID=A0A4R0RI80_9APHY|nr:hypothetical protein EIP91_002569 [Steccherinum ochraceum]